MLAKYASIINHLPMTGKHRKTLATVITDPYAHYSGNILTPLGQDAAVRVLSVMAGLVG